MVDLLFTGAQLKLLEAAVELTVASDLHEYRGDVLISLTAPRNGHASSVSPLKNIIAVCYQLSHSGVEHFRTERAKSRMALTISAALMDADVSFTDPFGSVSVGVKAEDQADAPAVSAIAHVQHPPTTHTHTPHNTPSHTQTHAYILAVA